MECRNYRSLTDTELEHGLPEVQRLELERHLVVCLSCRQYKEQLVQLQNALAELPMLGTPEGFTEDLLAKLPSKQRQRTIPHPYLSPRIRALGATAALVLLLGSPLYVLVESPRPMVESSDVKAEFVIEDTTVIVPAGTVVKGDVTVYNAHLKILGTVEGNIELVSSRYTLESGSTVSGRVEMVNWSWLDRLKFELVQMRQDVKSYVKGAWK